MSILLFNANGAHPTADFPEKPLDLTALSSMVRPSITVLTETHYTNADDSRKGIHATSGKKRKGVSAIPGSHKVLLTKILEKKGRLLLFDADIPGIPTLRVAAVYAPSEDDRKKIRFIRKLRKWVKDPPDILLGDFNITLRIQDRLPTKPLTAPANALRALLRAWGLKDPAPRCAPHTFRSRSGRYTARLDRVYVRKGGLSAVLAPLKDPALSDHSPVLYTLYHPKATPTRSPLWRMNREVLEEDFLREDLNSLFECYSATTPTEAILRWDKLKDSARKTIRAGERLLATARPPVPFIGLGGGEEGAVAWRTHLRSLLRQRTALRRANVDKTRGLPSRLLSLLGETVKPTMVRVVREDGGIKTETPEIVAAFATFYKDLYQEKPSDPPVIMKPLLRLPGPLRRLLATPPSQIEIAEALSQLDKDSSPGPDGLSYALYDSPAAVRALEHLLTHVWATGSVPLSWKDSVIRPLPKEDKDPSLVSNYRPIALANCDSKICSSIINARLMPFLVKHIPLSQTGFIRGRSTEAAILRLSSHLRKNPKARALLLDFEKAYDRVSHKWLQHILTETRFPSVVAEIILNMNQGETRLVVNNTLSLPLPLLSGVKQGDPLSPSLFLLCLLPLLTALESKGIFVQAHADDTAVVLKSRKDLHTTLQLLRQYEAASGQRVNPQKCTLLVPQPDPRFINHPFAEAANDRYLGVSLSWDGDITLLPQTRNRYLHALRRWKSRCLDLKERTIILKCYLRPSLLYQLPYADTTDLGWVAHAEHWFLHSARSEYEDWRSYKPVLSQKRGEHILSMWGLLPISLEVQRRQLGIFIALRDLSPTLTNKTTSGPLQRIKEGAMKMMTLHRIPDTTQSRKEARQLLKQHLLAQPLPLTKRQQDWERQHKIAFATTLKALYKLRVRSRIEAFTWRVLQGALPLGSHYKPSTPCPICGGKEDTTHLFGQEQPGCIGEQLLSEVLINPTDTQPVIRMWAIWKTRCWAKHHETGKKKIDYKELVEKIWKDELERNKVLCSKD